ncbi:hypothetical protein [Mucilaginibacter antarcticus]|uniref:Lipoprotein n=1 Tax=Mucilaginibacter antarcticus TaxID=1855725 RepID=A0ABW5XQ29_9SPHI
MKTLLIITACLLGFALVFSCNGTSVIKQSDTVAVPVGTSGKNTALNTGTEYIAWDEARINGTIPMITTTKLLYTALGKPDSIVTQNMENVCVSYYYDRPFKNVYIKGSSFELYGDTVVISSLNFRQPGVIFTAGKLRFDNRTTLSAVAKLFPKAVGDQSNVSLENNEKVISIRIETGKVVNDSAWHLLFKNGKLITIDFWMPC